VSAKKTDISKPESLGRGRKRCPSCKQIIAARATKCRFCEFEFLPASRKGVSVRRGMPDQATLEKLVAFINSHGGLESAKNVVADVRTLVQHIGSLDLVVEELNLVNLIKQQVQE